MKLYFSLISIILFIVLPNDKMEDEIIGEYYSNIYSCDDLKKDLSLVKEIPEKYHTGETPYESEYDVTWKFNFLKNGDIEITRMFEYYCGNIAILEKGKWSKAGKNIYKISIEGLCYDEPFKQEKKYKILKLENSKLKLKIK